MLLGEDEETQCRAVKCPQCLMPAGNDPEHYKDGSLKAIIEGTGNACVVQEFPEAAHGWVPRGDATSKEVARDVEAAIALATSFFGEHL